MIVNIKKRRFKKGKRIEYPMKKVYKLLGNGLLAATFLSLCFSGMHYFTINNKEIKDGNTKSIYKADFPFGYTKLTVYKDNKEILLEKFRLNKHTHTWWDSLETEYLDAFYNGRWYNPWEDDVLLAREKKNLESELKRFDLK